MCTGVIYYLLPRMKRRAGVLALTSIAAINSSRKFPYPPQPIRTSRSHPSWLGFSTNLGCSRRVNNSS